MKKYYLSALAALTLTTSSAFAGGPDDYYGSMWLTAAQFCPVNTIEANGQIYQVQQYQALAALYGNTYGGDGRNTFGVPDMRGKMPIGAGQSTGTSLYNVGDKVGQESANTALPSHTHAATFTPSPITVNIPVSSITRANTYQPKTTNNYLAASSAVPTGAQMWSSTNTNPINLAGVTSSGGVGGGSVSVAPAGVQSPSAITTIPPQLGLRFCIVTYGNWPSRD
jgi:microcystin-dependent protein